VDVAEEFSRCVIRLLYKEPFFGHLLAGVVRHFGEHTPTAAVGVVSGQVTVYVNPTFFLERLADDSERIAVVKHEVLHLLFKHVVRARGRKDHRLWNIAADLVVNQWIGAWRLPEGAVTLATFPDLQLARDRTADAYYERLSALAGEIARAGGDLTRVSAPASARALARLGSWHSDHGPWVLTEEDGELGGVAVDGWIARTASRAGAKGWGDLPGPLHDLVAASLQRLQPKVDWRRVLRLFSTSSRHTRLVSTSRRPSRRFGSYPGNRVRRQARIAVAVDTSGSVTDAMLSAFFAEVRGMWRRGTEVHVVECDAAVQRVYRYEGALPEAVAGRGGTSVDPVFEWLRRDRKQRWDGCVYLTDGEFPAPRVKPPCKLLWVLTPGGSDGEHLRHGARVRLAP